MSEFTCESEEYGPIKVTYSDDYTGKAIATWLNKSGYRQGAPFPSEILRKVWTDGFEGGVEYLERMVERKFAGTLENLRDECVKSAIERGPPIL